MSDWMRKVLLSRISAAIEGVLIMISKTATRPGLSMRGMSNCEITACKHRGKLDADLLLLVGRKGVDDAVNGLGRAGRVQRAEDQVARFPPP